MGSDLVGTSSEDARGDGDGDGLFSSRLRHFVVRASVNAMRGGLNYNRKEGQRVIRGFTEEHRDCISSQRLNG